MIIRLKAINPLRRLRRPFGDWWLLAPALFVGFLGGGGVYVGAFTLIALEQPAAYVELALSSASVADTLGMILARGED